MEQLPRSEGPVAAIPDGPPGPQGLPGADGQQGPPGQGPVMQGNWRLLRITGPAGAAGEVTLLQLNAAIQAQASRNCDAVQMLDGSGFSAEGQAIVAKINELLAVLHSPI